MPKPQETCVVTINGREFRDWESVQASTSYSTATRVVVLTVTESPGTNGKVGQALQIKPGDQATVTLAGQLFLSGRVYERQAAFDANNHSVRVAVASNVQPTTRASVPLKDGNFKGYNFQAIANKVLAPLGVKFKVQNPPPGFDKPFRNVQTEPGESVWTLLERLSRYRGIRLIDDAEGNLVAHGSASKDSKGGLVEGQNILSASAQIEYVIDTSADVVGSQKGSDTTTPDQNRGSAAKYEMSGGTYKVHSVAHMDVPGDADDARRFAETHQLLSGARQATAQIVSQGWLLASGKLPAVYDSIEIDSPMLMLKTNELPVAELLFSQDQSGTRTTWLFQKVLSKNPDVNGSPPPQTPAQEATQNDITPGNPVVNMDYGRGHVT
ncbi:hypothetical protein C5L14_23265 [Labrys okinawensis]|uniref:Phage tail protein n=1 Tax=Labrys okinawensis TaxID=346911 RepID=A0A2S9Q7M6_9HYPH|nr:hypothetical protein [Labrys okinawensis]PRH85363.1 hypothetical protein C5L14_23265 [Labrys okinawensis]